MTGIAQEKSADLSERTETFVRLDKERSKFEGSGLGGQLRWCGQRSKMSWCLMAQRSTLKCLILLTPIAVHQGKPAAQAFISS